MAFKPEKIKNTLTSIVDDMSSDLTSYVKNPDKDFTRNRKLGFNTLVNFMLSISGGSINKEIFKYFKKSDDIMTASAFVQQRDKLSDNTFKDLFYRFNDSCNDGMLLNGKYRLLAVDGSDINIALDKDADTFVKPKTVYGNKHSNGYNQMHLNALYDVLNKTYTDCLIQPKPVANERKALSEMICKHPYDEPTIVLADRGYPSMNLFAHFNHIDNLYYLFRTKNNELTFVRDLPMEELDIDIDIIATTNKSYQGKKGYIYINAKKNALKNREYTGGTNFRQWDHKMFEPLTIRVVRFKITEDTYETIFTSLPRDEFDIKEIKRLYGKRWGIETSFRELKYAIGLLNFHSKREDFIIQEIYAHLIMYNYCERITKMVSIKRCKDRKYEYQINYTMAIVICMDYFINHKNIKELYNLMSNYILPIKPNRTDRRKIKPKSAIFFIYRIAA